jgi:hypothetical protein
MADRPSYSLLANAAATGGDIAVARGTYALQIDGTFSGATIKLQIKSAAGNYIDVANEATMTAAGQCLVDLPDCVVRAAISAGPPSGVYVTLSQVRG